MKRLNVLIVLNGSSSSGKTTIAQALAPVLGEACLVTGLDDILERVQPFGRAGGSLFDRLIRPWRVLWFQLADGRLKLFKRLHREVVAQYQQGRSVVVDTALMDKRALRDAAASFAPLGGFLIGVKPPLEISEQWEAARGDRAAGHARAHYAQIHAHGRYDLVLDPSRMTPRECAAAILKRVQEAPPEAFQHLKTQAG